LLSKLLEFLTFTAQIKLIMDIGLTSISFFTASISIFLASGSICREIEQKTFYTVLTQPVSQLSFILGNFLGMIWVILVTLAITGLTLFMLLFLLEGFNIRSKAVQGIPISAHRIAISLVYAAIYICTMLTLSYLILERREL